MCVPGSSYSASKSGWVAVVTVPTSTLPRTVSSALAAGSTRQHGDAGERTKSLAERLQLFLVAAEHLDPFQRQRGADGADMAFGLPAGTEDAGDPSIRAR